jgi:sugar phosphate isomerase/epimerase
MNIGLSSYSYRWSILFGKMGIIEFLEKSLDLGVSVVQICENLDFDKLSSIERKTIESEYNSKIKIETGFRGHNPVKLKNALIATSELGGTLMRLVLEEEDEENLEIDTLLEELNQVLPIAKDLDIEIALENHFLLTPNQLKNICETIASDKLSVCFDCFNSIVNNVGTYDALEQIIKFVSRIHVKDIEFKREGTGFLIQGCPMGSGVLDIDKLLNILSKYDKKPDFLLEGWLDRVSSDEATIENENKVNEIGINYLRRVLS